MEVQTKLVVHYLRIQKTDSEWSLASAYVLHLYKLYRLHILEENFRRFKSMGISESSEVCYCQHQKRVLVLVDFQDKANTV